MSEITYKPTFESVATVKEEKVERRTVTVEDIFQRELSDQQQQELLPESVYALAQQIREQQKWVRAAQLYSELLEKSYKSNK